MGRSAVAALAFVTLLALAPSPAAAQNPQAAQQAGAHEVVRGNTLWDLAEHFYGDPFRWPRIWEANRDRVQDPHWIYPGQVLRIPDLETGEIREVQVFPESKGGVDIDSLAAARREGPPVSEPMRPSPGDRTGAKPLDYRTVFFRDTTRTMGGGSAAAMTAVAADQFYSAHWLVPLEGDVEHLGSVEGFAGAEEIRGLDQTLRPFDELRVTFDGGVPAVGTRLQTFRVDGPLHEVGRIAVPTGVVEVTEVQPAGAQVVVRAVFERMSAGDMVRRLPTFPLEPGVLPQVVVDGPEATVLGFATGGSIKGLDARLFLDAGAGEGVKVGDEYVLLWQSGDGWGTEVEGRVQVIGVQDRFATARITDVENPVFERGVRVRLSKRLP